MSRICTYIILQYWLVHHLFNNTSFLLYISYMIHFSHFLIFWLRSQIPNSRIVVDVSSLWAPTMVSIVNYQTLDRVGWGGIGIVGFFNASICNLQPTAWKLVVIYIYSINTFNNNFTKIKVNKRLHAGSETEMKN